MLSLSVPGCRSLDCIDAGLLLLLLLLLSNLKNTLLVTLPGVSLLNGYLQMFLGDAVMDNRMYASLGQRSDSRSEDVDSETPTLHEQ